MKKKKEIAALKQVQDSKSTQELKFKPDVARSRQSFKSDGIDYRIPSEKESAKSEASRLSKVSSKRS